MSSLNKVQIIGRLGQDPEIRHTQSGTAVTTLSVATTEKWKDKQTGEQKEKTEWHRCVAWGRLGEVCGEYLRKGSLVYIEGSLETRKWEDQSGQDRYTTEIKMREMKMLGSKGDSQQQDRQQGGAPAQSAPAATAQEFEDDIPF